ncbi:major facilitator superfamily multidrug-resistance, DHA1 sub-family [Mycena belliarum]|uniref:Major facilitator superfamily multidrug-resistance, DHA1 sub-family n=1 Tax=Mycena belliarum TaxID=1033014 RepID=A0AAD6XNJ7_9AGAR|nr:major facilitator superfamily multidrug-resistance, DHA1 sub-family [Mycena belliae]
MVHSDGRRDGIEARRKRTRTPIPKVQVAIVLFIQFAEPITALVIYPFIVQFVRDTGITGGEESKTGFYAGLLESSFFLTESLTVFQFGRLSDVYGRRPVLLIGPLGLALSMLGFGLSKKYWSLFFFRCLQGACNGNIGVSKTVINEFSDSTNIADIFSMMPLVWSLGATLAPLMGGVLSNPATKWPATLGKIDLLKIHPYLLPCAAAAFMAFFSFAFALIGLKETLPSAVARPQNIGPPTETDLLLPAAPPVTRGSPPPVRALLIRPVLISCANHGLLAFCHMCHEALFPLFCATPLALGGLGLRPQNIGLILCVSGLCNAVVQIFLAGRLIRRYGPRRMFTAGFCALAALFAMYPLVGFLARRAGGVDAVVLLALVAQLSCMFVVYFAYASTQLFVMDAAPDPSSLGSVNGLAQMVGTVMRSAAPSFASSLFSLSVEHRLAGGNMVYGVLMVATLGAVRCSLLLPRTLRSEAKHAP